MVILVLLVDSLPNRGTGEKYDSGYLIATQLTIKLFN
jgi:hypothetical protein